MSSWPPHSTPIDFSFVNELIGFELKAAEKLQLLCPEQYSKQSAKVTNVTILQNLLSLI